jgi:hypothetical protein
MSLRRMLQTPVLQTAMIVPLCLLLAACSTGGPLVKPGTTIASGKLMIDSEMEWTRVYTGTRYQLWSIDGELLNRLYLIQNVREKEFIFLGERQTKRRPDGAFYHRDLRADELRDLILDGLRPATFGTREGLRFEFSLANEEGLKFQGMAAAFEHEKGLALAIFMAPSEYYYPRDEAKVSKMLETLRLK